MIPVLQAKDLTRHYRVSTGLMKPRVLVKALDGVSFDLEAGKTVAVVGESGCGKSTLARQLTMIETPDAGTLVIDGQDAAKANREQLKAIRTKVQIVFQNPYSSLNPRQKIGTQLSEALTIHTDLSASEREARVRSIMERVGLRHEHYYRYPHMFSGGQRQRIAIARAMMLNPKIVVADEPTSALDVSIQAQVLNLLMDLQDEFKTAYVFISHNLSLVEHVAHQVLVMYLGRVVEQGDKNLMFSSPLHPYTKALLSATPCIFPEDRPTRIKIYGELPSPLDPPTGCAFHKRCPYAQTQCITEAPALRPVNGRIVACHRVEEI